jgi:putative transcriptional regulator
MTAVTASGSGAGSAVPVHHLSDELLTAYAAGSLDEATGLVAAAHLTYCPDCRARAAQLDAVGGALLSALKPSSLSSDALDSVFARLDGDTPQVPMAPAVAANDNPTLPRVLQSYFGGDADAVAWKKLGMGVETAELALPTSEKRVFLLKVPAGKAVPDHTHDGEELVIVLQGAFTDVNGRFGRGDVAHSDDSVDHRPHAEAGEDCICLVVVDAPIRLTGPLGKVLNLFVNL